jgi:cellulose synthase/poly-beta-1,6-N-acetylglucosamine synthase-like glycosyltransferase
VKSPAEFPIAPDDRGNFKNRGRYAILAVTSNARFMAPFRNLLFARTGRVAQRARNRQEEAPESNSEPLRLLSVVIPAHNEEGCICSTVEHLHLELRLHDIPHEIVVVDDASTDSTWSKR